MTCWNMIPTRSATGNISHEDTGVREFKACLVPAPLIPHPFSGSQPSTLNPQLSMAEEIYSPGLEGVIAGETAISTVSGGLSYRGYSIEDLARNGTFEEVAYLLLYDELPNANQLDEFNQRIAAASEVPAPIIEAIPHIPASASTMDVLR